jgi:hypothetical protein
MGRSAKRRRNKQIRKLKAKLEAYPSTDHRHLLAGTLLRQWERQAAFRAEHFTYHDGQPVPPVWQLYQRKRTAAALLDADGDLQEICRQAIAKHMKPGKRKLGPAGHLGLATATPAPQNAPNCQATDVSGSQEAAD